MMKKLNVILLVGVLSIASFAVGFSLKKWWPFATTSLNINMQEALQTKNIVPIVVIGAGPAGYGAAGYAARERVKTIVILGNKPGGALTETTYIENWPGEGKIMGSDLMTNLQQWAKKFGAEMIADSVQELNLNQWPFKITLENGKALYALAVIIATGSIPNKLQIPGEDTYWGKGVTTCSLCDAPYHKDQDVVVIGGGDSAIEEAMQLSAYAKKVIILVRGSAMRASASMQQHLTEYPNIEVRFNISVKSIEGDGNKVTGITIQDNTTKTTSPMPISGVFLAIGHLPNIKIFQSYVTFDKQGYIVLPDRTQKTFIPGVFIAGDVADNRYRQAITAGGDGVKAGIDAVKFLQEHGFSNQIAQAMEPNFFNSEAEGSLHVTEIKTLKELEEIFDDNEGLVAVDFYAPYCPSCMRMLPAVEAVGYQLVDQVTFVKVDMSSSNELADYYHVPSVPCLLVFKDKKLIARYNEAMSKKELYDFMINLIQKGEEQS